MLSSSSQRRKDFFASFEENTPEMYCERFTYGLEEDDNEVRSPCAASEMAFEASEPALSASSVLLLCWPSVQSMPTLGHLRHGTPSIKKFRRPQAPQDSFDFLTFTCFHL